MVSLFPSSLVDRAGTIDHPSRPNLQNSPDEAAPARRVGGAGQQHRRALRKGPDKRLGPGGREARVELIAPEQRRFASNPPHGPPLRELDQRGDAVELARRSLPRQRPPAAAESKIGPMEAG